MKIIDLLNKIANGEEVPKKIRYQNYIYEYRYRRDTKNSFNYMCNENGEYLSQRYFIDNILNDEVENLEEKKMPERVLNAEVFDVPKLNNMELSNIALKNKEDIKIIKDTLNKVLDYLKSKGE